jgi:hypothetical protein
MLMMIVIDGKVVFVSTHNAMQAYRERGAVSIVGIGQSEPVYPAALVVVATARRMLTARGGN